MVSSLIRELSFFLPLGSGSGRKWGDQMEIIPPKGGIIRKFV